MSANQHIRLSSETNDKREARLDRMSANQHIRLSTETNDKREARIDHMSANQHIRLSIETNDEREARLDCMSANQHIRLSTETNDKREARLEHQSANHHLRLAVKTDDEREARMECVADLMQQRRDLDERLPLHEQHHVQAAMHSFHAEMSSVQIPTCSTCMETFPGMKINSRTSECLRCTHDRREPKLYSSSNNMHPGAVPTELQVRLKSSPIHQTYLDLHEVQCRYSYLQKAECKLHRSVYFLVNSTNVFAYLTSLNAYHTNSCPGGANIK